MLDDVYCFSKSDFGDAGDIFLIPILDLVDIDDPIFRLCIYTPVA